MGAVGGTPRNPDASSRAGAAEMASLALHHVSVITSDLAKSLPFYCELFGLVPLVRPNFRIDGAWLGCGSLQIHLVVNPDGTFRKNAVIDRNDWHFAFRTEEFDSFVERLESLGFHDGLPSDDPKYVLIDRTGLAGFSQLYLLDPDLNVVEVNAAP
jgi:catechol 2,3-dioxygenase-like lactoylglutathione lyase family enzyme